MLDVKTAVLPRWPGITSNRAETAFAQLADVGNDSYQTPAFLQIGKRADSHIQGFGVKRAKTFIDQNGIKADTSRIGLYYIGKP